MKRILYLCTAPPPALAGTDAVYQEIDRLRTRNGGALLSLYPFKKPSRFVPHWLMGAHNRSELKEAMEKADVLHVFSATLKPLPCMDGFSGRIIYTVTAAAGTRMNATWFNDRRVTVVSMHEREQHALKSAGLQSVSCVLPGMDLSGMTFTPPPRQPFTLMVGSAPWTRAQFKTKGIAVLFEAMKEIPNLHLVCLWRNLLHDDLVKRIRKAGLENRIVVHNRKMNVNQVLASCHAATVLAANERLVKVWPHSAIESLAAGKPVLLSRSIPMSDFAEQHRAGITSPTLQRNDIVTAIQELQTQYEAMAGERLQALSRETFHPDRMTESYQALYEAPGLPRS